MIKPRKSKFYFKLLQLYSDFIIARDFQKLNCIGDFKNEGKAVLVIGNHSTWWDGFWMLAFNKKVLKKAFHVLMLERELAKRPFFARVGAYSINADKGAVKESLIFTKQLLQNPENMVLFFPEGKFSPAVQNNKRFQRGIEFLFKDEVPFTTIFVACITDYFAQRKPSVTIYFEQITLKQGATSTQIEDDYNAFFNRCIKSQNLLEI